MHEKDKLQTVFGNMGRIGKDERKELFMSTLSVTAFKVIASAIATSIIGTELIKLTLEQRGYFAVGGEWIALIFFFIGFYKLMSLNKRKPFTK